MSSQRDGENVGDLRQNRPAEGKEPFCLKIFQVKSFGNFVPYCTCTSLGILIGPVVKLVLLVIRSAVAQNSIGFLQKLYLLAFSVRMFITNR